ncbi:Serine--tRNA ligase [Candidatus Clavichlamydia salmonicola]|uniref:serine--tRNA ligase n=1 Tax=Candidatus Clavichlamydia salmonicola TaxID=469812 RepID=UPI001891E0B8|nr:serine--tRNA ligase [Candidatus Clavichlamydia salmonicola]MBF5050529.1 Serine--tRNA ligase [Candidatus Clavichlamydia salmonicola]
MLDIKLLRKDKTKYEALLQLKIPNLSLTPVLEADQKLRQLKTFTEGLQAEKKALSKETAILKAQGKSFNHLFERVQVLSSEITASEILLNKTETIFFDLLSHIPNIPSEEVPQSSLKADNKIIKIVGQKPAFNFLPKHHLELNESLALFDFHRTAKTSGSGWPAYCGRGALLEWALLSYMKDKQYQHGFQFWLPPLAVRREILFGSGQIPKFDGQYYEVLDGENNLFLIPTSEVVLNGLHFDEILPESSLPIKYSAYSPCFRKEAGAAGAQERGLVRIHQFNKIEMFGFASSDNGEKMLYDMLAVTEDILQGLDMHYQFSLLSAGDMSFTANKTIDVEVWLPGQNQYYEVSSVSACTDYQSRRSKIRCRKKDGSLELVHTFNGSGLATPRLLVAILENNQDANGNIKIPNALLPYLAAYKEFSSGFITLE